MENFIKEPLHIDDIVVYIKNERTGSSTIRKCKFLGYVIGFTNTKVKIRQISKADQFASPEECDNYGEVSVCPEDVICVLSSPCRLNKDLYFPCIMGDITFWNKEELTEWVENQQKINEVNQIKIEISEIDEKLIEAYKKVFGADPIKFRNNI